MNVLEMHWLHLLLISGVPQSGRWTSDNCVHVITMSSGGSDFVKQAEQRGDSINSDHTTNAAVIVLNCELQTTVIASKSVSYW